MNFLENILIAKHQEVDERKRTTPLESLREGELYHLPRRSLESALRAREFGIISEVKRSSPSKGLIRKAYDPASIGEEYERAGASAVSVVTDEKFFGGSLEDLSSVRRAIDLPLLRKDFLIDRYQLHEARAAGADAVLLVVGALEPPLLAELDSEARELGLEALIEVHDEGEMRIALGAGVRLLGINNRDLKTFETRLETSERLAPLLPGDAVAVSESGITSVEDLRRLRRAGYRGALIGEFFMRQDDPGAALAKLLVGLKESG